MVELLKKQGVAHFKMDGIEILFSPDSIEHQPNREDVNELKFMSARPIL